ncbi:hypothetical protein [Sorangium sp. So ce1099]|uniref:hypothetical protein n=1 Tax=Sorangium sp. So ce1099 TaxID=3133331 RepID=UPI003F63F772
MYDPLNPVNTPELLILSHDTSGPRDAHGVAHSGQEEYVYFFDRAANVVEIYRAATGAYVKTESLVSPFSSDPTPDLAGEAPDGKCVYLPLRGPNPLSGDPHASTGSMPRLLVIELLHHGRDLAVCAGSLRAATSTRAGFSEPTATASGAAASTDARARSRFRGCRRIAAVRQRLFVSSSLGDRGPERSAG